MGRRVAPALDAYLDDVGAGPLLSADDERRLAAAIAAGDAEARRAMIRANLRLVVRIARSFLGRGLAMEDLVGEGNVGLVMAVDRFDPSRGVRFSTYASYWIKQAIRHAILNRAATIRLPAHMAGVLTRWRRAAKALRRDLGRDPSPERIADALGLSPEQREMVERAFRARGLRLDSERPGDGRDDGFGGIAAVADPAPPVEEAVAEADDAAEARAELRRRLVRLDPRERAVVAQRFGLDGAPKRTLLDVAAGLGVTREWVRKLERRAVGRLRAADAP